MNALQMCSKIIRTNVCQMPSCKHQSCDAESQGFELKPLVGYVDGGGGLYLYTHTDTHQEKKHSYVIGMCMPDTELSLFNLLSYLSHRHTHIHTHTLPHTHTQTHQECSYWVLRLGVHNPIREIKGEYPQFRIKKGTIRRERTIC